MNALTIPAVAIVHDAARRSGTVETIPITSREQWLAARQQDVTASAIGALVGVHDYLTAYGLFCLKAGLTTEDPEESPAMRRGRLLEPVALAMLAEDRPDWIITAANDLYWRLPQARIGATPDAFAVRPDMPGRGVVQVKTASDMAFRKKWRDEDGAVQAPTWIACQAITEAMLTGASWACIVLLVAGNGIELHVIDVPLHKGVWQRLAGEVNEFWQRIENNLPYDPDYARDASVIHRLNADDDGETIDLSIDNRIAEILAAREALKAVEKAGSDAEKARRALDAEIIAKLGSATYGRLADGRLITAKTTRREGYSVKPSTYRTIRIKGEAA